MNNNERTGIAAFIMHNYDMYLPNNIKILAIDSTNPMDIKIIFNCRNIRNRISITPTIKHNTPGTLIDHVLNEILRFSNYKPCTTTGA